MKQSKDEFLNNMYIKDSLKECRESEDMDAEAFAAWYTRLASLSGDGTLPEDFALSGESRATRLLPPT